MTKFDPTAPATQSLIKSEPIRNNLNVLNDRTDHLTPSATNPATTNVSIGKGTPWFEDNTPVPFSGALLDLGSSSTGVSKFNSIGGFKEIIVFYKPVAGIGQLGFIEGVEKTLREHTVDTATALITDPLSQRQADAYGDAAVVDGATSDLSPLDNSIIICSILVTNDGTTTGRGKIVSLFDSDIIDLRPFMHRTFETKALAAHVDAKLLSTAHPGAAVTNSIIRVTATRISTGGDDTNTNVLEVVSPTTFSVGDIIRYVVTDGITQTSDINDTTEFATRKVTVVEASPGTITVDSNIATIKADHYVIKGELTLDRMTFDIVDELSNVMFRDTSGNVQLNETSIRLAGDQTLQTNLNAEVSIRAAYGTSETSIRLAGDTNEVSIRLAGDQTLQTNLNAEVSIRAAYGTSETSIRLAGDTNEASIRLAGDQTLQTNLNAEVSIRAAYGTSETSLRLAGDTNEASIRLASDTNEASIRLAGDQTALKVNNNLSDLNSFPTARTSLGIYCGRNQLSAGVYIVSGLTFNPTNYSIVITLEGSDVGLPPTSEVYIKDITTTPDNRFTIKSDSGSDTRWVNWIAIQR